MSRLNAGLYSSDDQTWWSPPDFVAAVLGFEERERFEHVSMGAKTEQPPLHFFEIIQVKFSNDRTVFLGRQLLT